MNTSTRVILLSAIFSLLFALPSQAEEAEKKLSLGEQPIFKVSKSTEPIVVDGKMDEAIWAKTEAREFKHFYRVDVPNDQQRTTLRMLWDETHVYLFYDMNDKYLTAREKERDGQPYFDDCAEVFFVTVPAIHNTHIGYELNLYKASNDFVYFDDYYQGKHAVLKSFNPEFTVEVTHDGTINDNSDEDQGWTMELAIPIANFTGLEKFVPVKAGNRWAFLAVRQDRNDAEGNRRSTSTIFPIYDIEKNVHQPNRFGLMEFVE